MFKKKERETTTVSGVTTERPSGIRSASAWHGTTRTQLSCLETETRVTVAKRDLRTSFLVLGLFPSGFPNLVSPSGVRLRIFFLNFSFFCPLFFFQPVWFGEGGDRSGVRAIVLLLG